MHAELAAEWIPGEPEKEGGDCPEAPDALVIPFDAYYDVERKEYLILNADQRWLPQTLGQFNRRLRNAGIADKAALGRISQHIEDHSDVKYAAPLAGRPSGFFQENGIRILVTSSPDFIDPIEGDWGTLRSVMEGLFVDSEEDHGCSQWNTFNGWLRVSIDALRNCRRQDGQALAIAGERDCGKSLIQHLITSMLGGRSAKGARYMMGKTDFNAELFECEHVVLEDEFMSHSITERLKLGTAIKNFTVSTQMQSCHRKQRTAVNLSPWWRVSISLNDDAEALQVLPPLDDHIADKIILLRASRFDLPMETHTPELREAFGAKLRSELPAFIYWLLHEFEIDEDLEDRRFGIATWQHPDLRRELAELAPETRLLSLIDEALFGVMGSCEWQGTAKELERELLQRAATRRDAEKLLNWPNASGAYLGRLATQLPARVELHRTATQRIWTVRKENDAVTDDSSN
ncbi:MAG: hypothetical protein ACI8UO_005395 [Verrucomicrobiales bacterium]|jgi:hypothetical protein